VRHLASDLGRFQCNPQRRLLARAIGSPDIMTPPLLAVSNLSKSFGRPGLWRSSGDVVPAVIDVSFEVGAGQTLGIVGASGSGKTTLLRLLARLIEADSGTIRFDGTDLRTLSGHALRLARRQFQIVAQDPASAFDPRVRVGAAIAAAVRLHRLRHARGIATRVAELLVQVGLSPDLQDRYPHEVSGGQLQRLAIAQALAVEPRLLLLDEVASALDASVKAGVLGLLQDLQRALGTTYVFIGHDIRDVFRMADTVGVMCDGLMVEQGAKRVVFDNPQHDCTKSLLATENGQDLHAGGEPAANWTNPLSAKALLRLQVMSKIAAGQTPSTGTRQPSTAALIRRELR
jgi:ABC-type glutathione transport system ATPase component